MHLAERRPLVSVLATLATAAVAVSMISPPASATAERHTGDTVVDGHARFQVLSPTLVRLEYAADDKFQDGTTLNVVDRDLSPTAYRTDFEDGWRVITTSDLTLRYREGSGPFTPDNTSVTLRVNGRQVVAHPRWQSQPCVFG